MYIKIKQIREISIDANNNRLCGLNCPLMYKFFDYLEDNTIKRANCSLENGLDLIMTPDKCILRNQTCLNAEEIK